MRKRAICLDIKRELYNQTAGYRASRGHIIPDTLWAECNIRKYRKKTKSNGKIERIRKKNPFHSLIFCGVCGDNKNLANSQRYVCSGFKYHKTCANGRGMKFNEILIHIFQFLRSEIEKISSKDWDDKIFKEFAQEKLLEIDLGKELEQVDQNISNVVSLIDEGIGFDQVREKLRDLQEKKAELTVLPLF